MLLLLFKARNEKKLLHGTVSLTFMVNVCVCVCVCVWVSALFMSCGWPWPCCLAGWHRQSEGVREQSLALRNTHTHTNAHTAALLSGEGVGRS